MTMCTAVWRGVKFKARCSCRTPAAYIMPCAFLTGLTARRPNFKSMTINPRSPLGNSTQPQQSEVPHAVWYGTLSRAE